MPDTTVEILNATIPYGDSVAGVPLFTTNGSTRYVIKDVQLASDTYSSTVTKKLLINDTPVGNLHSNLTGSEIVDINSSVKMSVSSTDTEFSLRMLGGINGTTGTLLYPDSSGVTLGATLNLTSTPTTINALTNPSTVQNFAFVGSDFYYWHWDGNADVALYKRTGGVNGTQTTIVTPSYGPIAFDYVSNFYYYTTSGLQKYNATTGTTTTVDSTNIGPPSTYPWIAFCNGVVFYLSIYTGTVRAFNTVNNTGYSISGATINNNLHTPYLGNLRPIYNPVTYRYRFLGSTQSHYFEYQSNATNTAFSTITTGTAYTKTSTAIASPQETATPTFMYQGSGSTQYRIGFDLTQVTRSLTINGTAYTSVVGNLGKFTEITPTQELRNATGLGVKVRITGVKQD